MLSIPRSVARLVRAVFRKVGDVGSRDKPTAIRLRADASGLRVQARAGGVGAEFHLSGSFETKNLSLPVAAFADFEGADDSNVTFFVERDGQVRADWIDAGVPQRRSYEVAREPMPWLNSPQKLSSVSGSVLPAIVEAMSAAADSSVRFALNHVFLRGSKSEAVGTDGRQLLVVRGVPFPWKDDVLVPRTRLLELKAFSNVEAVAIERTDVHIVVRAGPWTAWLGINKDGRFPDYTSVIPRGADDATRLILSDNDAEFLATRFHGCPARTTRTHRLPCTSTARSLFAPGARAGRQRNWCFVARESTARKPSSTPTEVFCAERSSSECVSFARRTAKRPWSPRRVADSTSGCRCPPRVPWGRRATASESTRPAPK